MKVNTTVTLVIYSLKIKLGYITLTPKGLRAYLVRVKEKLVLAQEKFKIIFVIIVSAACILLLITVFLRYPRQDHSRTIVFSDREGWYFIIYDSRGSSVLTSTTAIDFTLGERIFYWNRGASIISDWIETRYFVRFNNGHLSSLNQTRYRIYNRGNTGRRINNVLFDIEFMYLGTQEPVSDYQSQLSDVIVHQSLP